MQPLTQSITLTNNGTVPATLNSLTFPPSPYGILTANTSTCPSIAVNGSCTITVTLQPGSYGVLTTTAAINLSFKSLSATSTLPISATILNPLSLNTTLAPAYQSTPYSVNINSTLSHHSLGNNLSPVVWTASAMPAGWTLSSTGTLSGTPTTLSSLTFPVTAQYATYTVSGTYTLTVNPLSISTPFLLDFGAVYSRDTAHTLSATITNTSSTTLSYIKPTTLSSATDLSISSNTCTALAPAASCQIALSFNPATPNPLYSSTLTLNYGITAATHTTVLPITAQVNNPLNLTTNLPSPIVGLPFSYSLSTNLTSALETLNLALTTWTLSSALPAGITFNPSTGILSGTATSPEALNLAISASYKGNTLASIFPFATTQHLLLIQPPLTDLGTLYQGNTPTPITLTLTNASYRADTSAAVSLPFLTANPLQIGTPTPDLTITSTTCTTSLLPAKSCTVSLSLNPATITSQAITVSASSGVAPTTTSQASAAITAEVVNPLQLVPANLPILAENITTTLPFQPYLSHALQPLVPPVATWTATPLPAGLTLNATTGKIAGVPTVHGNYTLTLTATTKTNAASQTYDLKIVNPGVQLSPSSLDFGAVPTNWDTAIRTITATNSADFAQQISYSISTATNPYLLLDASSTCTDTLAPHTSCQWTWRYAPTTASQNLLNNFAVSATIENITVLQRATFVGTTYNPLALSDTLPQAFVGVPFSYPLHTNLSASTTTNLNLAGLDWTGSNYRVNLTTGIVAFTPTSINPVVFSAKATLRGNSISRIYTLTPIATSFALTASPSPINLGAVYINHVPASATVTLTNPGSYSAEITAAPYFSSSTAEHPFTITASTCPAALNPGMSCTITFQYAPTMAKASVATTLIVPVGKNGATLTKTSVPISASALQPLTFSSALQQPIVGIPYSYNFNPNITSAIEPIAAPSLTWTVDAGSPPSGLTFNKGLVSGTPTSTTAASITLTAYYKNNRITRTFAYTPTQISATQTPPASDLGIVYPGTTKSTTFTLQNTSTNQNLTIEAPPALSAATPYTSISFNSCTAGRTLLPLTACSTQVTFTPTSPTNPLSVSLKTGVGYRGTITQWLQTSVSMDSNNSLSWSPVPSQTLSQSFPTSIDLRPFLNVVNIPNLSRANIVWTTSGSLPAGLTFSQGIISGTPTTLQATNFQVSAAYAGNSSTSNIFTLQVVEPVVFVPPPSSPPLFASALNPANMGLIFAEQAKTMTTSWRVNVPSTITATPYIQTSPNGITISSHTCAPVGTVVPAGYSCQATVQLKGLSTNIGNRSSKVVMGVGARTTTYSTASAYVAGSVLNPFVVYPQEAILSLAPNTPLVPASDFYVDRFPSGTPVTVSLRSAINYNDPTLPISQRYPSGSLPARLSYGYVTSGSVDAVQATFNMIMTVTKHTSPALIIEQPFVLKMRKSSNFAVAVQSQQGQFAGYPANTTTYKITNNHPVDITPTYGESFWIDNDFNPFDSITSTSTTDCIRNLPVQASCTYTRTVNPGTAAPNATASFGASRAFLYAPQPTTKPSRKTTATLYSTVAPYASSAGNVPNHYLTQMSSAHTLAEPIRVTDQGNGYPTLAALPMAKLVVNPPGLDYMTMDFSYGRKIPLRALSSIVEVVPSVVLYSHATGANLSGSVQIDNCPFSDTWNVSYENGYFVSRLKPFDQWTNFTALIGSQPEQTPYCNGRLTISSTLPSGRIYTYSKQYPNSASTPMFVFPSYSGTGVSYRYTHFTWPQFMELPQHDGAYSCGLWSPAGSIVAGDPYTPVYGGYPYATGYQCAF